MRVTIGTIAVLGLAVAVAVGQPPRERAAELKPPQPLAPGDLPPVARGVADEFPVTSLSSTPVTRPAGAPRPGVASGPAWLTGSPDPNVQPAAGIGTKGGAVRPLTPPAGQTKEDSPVQPKIIDRLKGAVSGDKQPPPQPLPQPVAQPQQQQPQATASTPFRGTGANGAPVYAGPPAYRWYGWGSVTPGANPLAPTGQYPKASANWYNITGATPGAFPVPVGTPSRMPSGTEPPNYGLAAKPTLPAPVVPAAAPAPTIQYVDKTPAPPVTQPKLTFTPPAPPAPAFVPPPTPAPVSVPVITAPPLTKPVAVTPPALPAPKPQPKPEQVATLPPIPTVPQVPAVPVPLPAVPSVTPTLQPEPAKLPVPVTESKPITTPSPLPTSVTKDPVREELRWQQSKEPTPPAPGTWAPAPGAEPLPTMTPGEAGAPVGRASGAPIVARGQMGDRSPDPITTLIKQVCQGRADGVEIRWTGTKKLQVCFEVRGAPEARRLVDDISKRSELTAYQIDFCVLVK